MAAATVVFCLNQDDEKIQLKKIQGLFMWHLKQASNICSAISGMQNVSNDYSTEIRMNLPKIII